MIGKPWPGTGKWCRDCGAIYAAPSMFTARCFQPCGGQLWHRGVQIHGDVEIGEGVSLAEPCDINGVDCKVTIGDHCDIAAFTTISCADSHLRTIGLSDTIERREIVIGHHVFVGVGAVILGGCVIEDYSVIGAGVVLKGATIPHHSRVSRDRGIEPGYYAGPRWEDLP